MFVSDSKYPHRARACQGNIAHLLKVSAQDDSGKTAIAEPGAVTTYGELLDRSGAFTAALEDTGLEPGERVAVFLEPGAEAAAGFFGAVRGGMIAVMVNEKLRTRQIEHILDHSGAGALLTSRDLLARQPREVETDARILEIESVERSGKAARATVPRADTDPAQIVYTSGSTGMPKGVTLSHGNLWAGVRSVSTYLELEASDRIASLLPFSFDYGFNQLMCSVYNGATLVIERSSLPHQIASTLRKEDITVLPAVPPLWLQLLEVDAFVQQELPELRVMTNTGGHLPETAVHELREAHPEARLYLMYGLTEAFRSTYLPPEEVERRPTSIGRAIPGADIAVVGDDGNCCESGEVGELVHRGPTVALGYWDDPDATSERFRSDPCRPDGCPDSERVVYSGDLVKRDEDGYLYFVSRRDELIKSLGFRVSPDEVTEILFASGEITEGVVSTESDEVRGEAIVAHVVLKEDGSLDRLRAFCKREAPRYMQPARFDVRESLPRTSSQKFDRRALETSEDPPAST